MVKSSYSAVGYSYNNHKESRTSSLVPAGPEVIEHPPTITVDVVEDERDMYYDPPGLEIPFYIERVGSDNNTFIIIITISFCLPPSLPLCLSLCLSLSLSVCLSLSLSLSPSLPLPLSLSLCLSLSLSLSSLIQRSFSPLLSTLLNL